MLELTPSRLSAPVEALRPLRFGFIAALAGRALGLSYRLRGKHRYDDFQLERVNGVPLLVIPSTFNPKVPRSGAFLAAHLEASRVCRDAEILDMGTGSGICAIFAAREARRVVAVDINPAAVRCARINALVNHLEERIDLRHGDLFAPVAGERFDLVLFNPPFLRGAPNDDRDRAWRSPDVAERFAAGLRGHLRAGGAALIVLSTFGDAGMFLAAFRAHGFTSSLLTERRFVNERLAVFRVEPRHEERAA